MTSRQSIYTWRVETNYSDPCPQLCNNNLDNFIAVSVKMYPYLGRIMMIGLIRQAGFQSTIPEIISSMHVMDPAGCARRAEVKGFRILRRIYNFTKPHALWHIDSNHKLVQFNLSIVGGIDGFSRT
jgi:hypothetical protein